MKASEKAGNQQKIEELEMRLSIIQEELVEETDRDVIDDLRYKEATILETLAYEKDYCSRCEFYDNGDYSVGINAYCDHEIWEDENGDVSDELNGKMVDQMTNSGECVYFVPRS